MKYAFHSRPYDPDFIVDNLVWQATEQAEIKLKVLNEVLMGSAVTDFLIEHISKSALFLADVTLAPSNVMLELGIAKSRNIPVILLAESSASVPFDLKGQYVFVYDRSALLKSIERLTVVIKEAIQSPIRFKLEGQETESKRQTHVFISYCHEDYAYLTRLLVHLKPLEQAGLIEAWVDTKLRAGDRWKTEIERALVRSTVAILLISADFLASEFIVTDELPPLLRQAEENGTRIIPLIIKPCRFSRDPTLKHFQAINDPRDALILIDIGKQESFYDAVAEEVERNIRRR